MLTWRPTRLLDVHFNAEQIVTQTSDTSSTGVLANAFQLGLDYELRRNVIVSLSRAVTRTTILRSAAQGQRHHLRHAHQISRSIDSAPFPLYHRYTERDSDIPAFSYDKHLVGINVTAQF